MSKRIVEVKIENLYESNNITKSDSYWVSAEVFDSSNRKVGVEIRFKFSGKFHIGTMVGYSKKSLPAIVEVPRKGGSLVFGNSLRGYFQVFAPNGASLTDNYTLKIITALVKGDSPVNINDPMLTNMIEQKINFAPSAKEVKKGINELLDIIKDLKKIHNFSGNDAEYEYMNNLMNHPDKLGFDKFNILSDGLQQIKLTTLPAIGASALLAKEFALLDQNFGFILVFFDAKKSKEYQSYLRHLFAQSYRGKYVENLTTIPYVFHPRYNTLDPLTYKEFQRLKSAMPSHYNQYMDYFTQKVHTPILEILRIAEYIVDQTQKLENQAQEKKAA